jgi:ABC-2 type transport system permease protein
MLNRILNLAFKELIQLSRDRMMLIFIIIGPVLELMLLVQSSGGGITHLTAVVVDQDHSQVSREIVTAIDNTEELQVIGYLDSLGQVETWLDEGKATLAVILPANLEADLAARAPQAQLIADGANTIAGTTALNAAAGAINALMVRRAEGRAPGIAAIDLKTQVRYNPTLNMRPVSVAAQLGFIIYQVTLMVSALGLARERELGTLEQVLVTPFRRIELLAGKAIPAVLIAVVNFVIMYVIVTGVYGVPMRGSVVFLMGLTLLFILAQACWGLIISTVSRTQQQAVLLVFVLVLIDVSFSGYMVPIDRMPPLMQSASFIFPLQHYLLILRGIMLRGSDLAALLPQALALIGLTIGGGVVALISLRNRLE